MSVPGRALSDIGTRPQARIEVANCPCQNGTLYWSTFGSVRAPLSTDPVKQVCTTGTCPSVCMCCHMGPDEHYITFGVWPLPNLCNGIWMHALHWLQQDP